MPITIQKSAFPELKEDVSTFTRKRKPNWKAKFKAFIKKEGLYNFCMMAQEIKRNSDEELEKKYKKNRQEVYQLLDEAFYEKVDVGETIESFLANTARRSNYTTKKRPKQNGSKKGFAKS